MGPLINEKLCFFKKIWNETHVLFLYYINGSMGTNFVSSRLIAISFSEKVCEYTEYLTKYDILTIFNNGEVRKLLVNPN